MDISGTWYNQLNSYMILHVNDRNVHGKYHSKVGDAWGEYDLVGYIDNDNDQTAAIGWVVVWNNDTYGSSDSVTSWSGQVKIDKTSSTESIVTTWLLTTETEADDEWHSTLIGKDIFTRQQPTGTEILHNISLGVKLSSPKILP